MAKIYIEDSLYSDGRYRVLETLVGPIIAQGTILHAIKMAQEFWLKNKSLIPKSVFNSIPEFSKLIEVELVEEFDDGYYVKGSKRCFGRIIASMENGKKGGRPIRTEPRRNLDETKTEPRRNLDETKTEPRRNLDETKTEPRRNLDETKTEPRRNLDEVFGIPETIFQTLKMQYGYPDEVIKEFSQDAWLLYLSNDKPTKKWDRFLAHYFKNERPKIEQKIKEIADAYESPWQKLKREKGMDYEP